MVEISPPEKNGKKKKEKKAPFAPLQLIQVYREQETLISRSVWAFAVAVARWQHRRGGKTRALDSF